MATPVSAPVDATASMIDTLWLDVLQRIVGRGAHELKGALNGVAVNLEVVRSRAEKPEAPASAVRTFANAAVDQLDGVIAMTEALLSLSRPLQAPVELGRVVRAVSSLLVPAARADGRELRVDGQLDVLGTTSADGSVARLAIAAALLAAIEGSTQATCRVVPGEDAPAIRIECSDGGAPALAEDVIAVTRGAGIRVQAESSAISITFPR